MPKSAPVAEPVKGGNAAQEHQGIKAVPEYWIWDFRIGQAGQVQQPGNAQAAQSQIGQKQQEKLQAMVLMEKNIHQVMFFRFGAQLQRLVVDVVEMLIEQHLSCKGQVQHQTVD